MRCPQYSFAMSEVVIIGGGLAGLSAAVNLADANYHITLLESRPRLGGRASSFEDAATGELIDNCQHVIMGCCTNFRHLLRTTALEHLLRPEPELYFVEPPESSRQHPPRITTFGASSLPAPLHLAAAFRRLSYLTWRQKLALARGLSTLARSQPDTSDRRSFADWLREQRQPVDVIERFWNVVLVSALSESVDRITISAARKVVVDGFLAHRDAWEMWLPTVPLDELYSNGLAKWLTERGIAIRLKTGAEQLIESEGRIIAVELRDGTQLPTDDVILAVPHQRVLSLLPESLRANSDLTKISQLESAPIASVHLWFDRAIMPLPHAVLVGRLSQWVFSKNSHGNTDNTSHAYQVVISAAREVAVRSTNDVIAEVVAELRTIWPEAASAELRHARVIMEHAAVFSPRPGSDELRPPQQSPIPNLQLAGDWTQTGWPATMEGAVRSGFLAADNVRQRGGLARRGLCPDLPTSRLARWLLT